MLFYNMIKDNDYGEVWYWGGKRLVKYTDNFYERRVSQLALWKPTFKPDIIFARGGFNEYDSVLIKFPEAFKIYYGANAKRYFPSSPFIKYDLILTDSSQQCSEVKKRLPNTPTTIMIKPAIDTILKPIISTQKYDAVFPANGTQPFKGHSFIWDSKHNDIKLLHLGFPFKNAHLNKSISSRRVQRKDIAKEYCSAKVGIVCSDKGYDSCPRVIPEMLCCGVPIVVTTDVNFADHIYITSNTGMVVKREHVWDAVKFIASNTHLYNPRSHYLKYLSLEKASAYLLEVIDNTKKGILK